VRTISALERVQAVIRDLILPSWYQGVPPDFGFSLAGTIKAAEWRALLSVHVPLGLVLEWGEGLCHLSEEVTGMARKLLDHTMFLVGAGRIVAKKITSVHCAEHYRELLTSYMRGLAELYPDFKAKPNHHLAFHIYKFLVLYGPAWSWWCFPFERLIGHLERLPHNHQHRECYVYSQCFAD
jgi:hypothetical protein